MPPLPIEKEFAMTKIGFLCARTFALACMVLGMSLPAAGQERTGGKVAVFKGSTTNIYILNYTRLSITLDTNHMSLGGRFPKSTEIAPFGAVGTTDLYVNEANSKGWFTLTIDSPSSNGYGHQESTQVWVVGVSSNQVITEWSFFYEPVGSGVPKNATDPTFKGNGGPGFPPYEDPVSGGCVFTNSDRISTAIYNSDYFVTMAAHIETPGNGAEQGIVIVVSEIANGKLGLKTYKKCVDLEDGTPPG